METDRGRAGAVWLDGHVVAAAEARISVFDRGLLLGDGVFEIMRTAHHGVVDLASHLARIAHSAQALQLRWPGDELAREAICAVVAAMPGPLRVRLILTRGDGDASARLADLHGHRLIVIGEPLVPPAALSPISLCIVDGVLTGDLAAHKSLAYLERVLAREAARLRGADEAIRLTATGDVGECAYANLFVVIDGRLTTPALDGQFLAGVTRARVLQLIGNIDERRVPATDLALASEAFVTSSVRGIVAVGAIDGRTLEAPGPYTQAVQRAYAAFVDGGPGT